MKGTIREVTPPIRLIPPMMTKETSKAKRMPKAQL